MMRPSVSARHPSCTNWDCLLRLSPQTVSSNCLFRLSLQTVSSNCLLRLSLQTVSSNCLFRISLQTVSSNCLFRLSLQTVSSDCLFRLSPQTVSLSVYVVSSSTPLPLAGPVVRGPQGPTTVAKGGAKESLCLQVDMKQSSAVDTPECWVSSRARGPVRNRGASREG